METEKDKALWKTARKRVGFKRHLASYIIINVMFWFIWYFTDRDTDDGFPWPVWPMLGWGIGILFSYLEAYVFNQSNAVEKEYEKLKSRD